MACHDETNIDLVSATVQRDSGGCNAVLGQPQAPGEVIGSAEWQYGEGLIEFKELRQGIRDRPIATTDNDAVGRRGHGEAASA